MSPVMSARSVGDDIGDAHAEEICKEYHAIMFPGEQRNIKKEWDGPC